MVGGYDCTTIQQMTKSRDLRTGRLNVALGLVELLRDHEGIAKHLGWRELVPCGFATHHDAHSCGTRHRA